MCILLFAYYNMASDKKVIFFGEKPKRATTNTWTFDVAQLSLEKQLEYIKKMKSVVEVENLEIGCIIYKEIDAKIGGYRSQDQKKCLYTPDKFVDREYVIDLLDNSENICYYCRQTVCILYETSREPKQWTLERIDNGFGHNKDNVVIACLKCNLTRKTMYHERFAFTKQMVIEKTN